MLYFPFYAEKVNYFPDSVKLLSKKFKVISLN